MQHLLQIWNLFRPVTHRYQISSHIIVYPGHPGNTSQQDETRLEQHELIHFIFLMILTFHSLDIFNQQYTLCMIYTVIYIHTIIYTHYTYRDTVLLNLIQLWHFRWDKFWSRPWCASAWRPGRRPRRPTASAWPSTATSWRSAMLRKWPRKRPRKTEKKNVAIFFFANFAAFGEAWAKEET